VCQHFAVALVQCNGEGDQVHLLIEYPPKVPVSALVNSFKASQPRRLRHQHRARTHRKHRGPLSHLATSLRRRAAIDHPAVAGAATHPGS
jgi:putative transposase